MACCLCTHPLIITGGILLHETVKLNVVPNGSIDPPPTSLLPLLHKVPSFSAAGSTASSPSQHTLTLVGRAVNVGVPFWAIPVPSVVYPSRGFAGLPLGYLFFFGVFV